jgi:hypothetical protein
LARNSNRRSAAAYLTFFAIRDELRLPKGRPVMNTGSLFATRFRLGVFTDLLGQRSVENMVTLGNGFAFLAIVASRC